MGECTRSGFCNFMHLKPISRDLRRYDFMKDHPFDFRLKIQFYSLSDIFILVVVHVVRRAVHDHRHHNASDPVNADAPEAATERVATEELNYRYQAVINKIT